MTHITSLTVSAGVLFAATVGFPSVLQAQSNSVLQAQSNSAPLKYPYPDNIVSGFVSQCSSSSTRLPPEVSQQLCRCIITKAQNQFSLQDFRKMSEDVDKGQPMPAAMDQIAKVCVDEVAASLKR
jgi:hypothetical protein